MNYLDADIFLPQIVGRRRTRYGYLRMAPPSRNRVGRDGAVRLLCKLFALPQATTDSSQQIFKDLDLPTAMPVVTYASQSQGVLSVHQPVSNPPPCFLQPWGTC